MIGFVVALLVLAVLFYWLLRNAWRWEAQPPWEPPSELVAQMRRMSEGLAKVGMSFADMLPAMQRLGDTLALVSETWVLGLHGKLPERDLCRLDGKPWPCPEHERLAASIATRRERLGPTTPKVSAGSSTL